VIVFVFLHKCVREIVLNHFPSYFLCPCTSIGGPHACVCKNTDPVRFYFVNKILVVPPLSLLKPQSVRPARFAATLRSQRELLVFRRYPRVRTHCAPGAMYS